MKGMMNILSFSLALGLLVFALPKLPIGASGGGSPMWFAISWICMMLLIIGAHLRDLIGVDEQTPMPAPDHLHQRQEQVQRTRAKG